MRAWRCTLHVAAVALCVVAVPAVAQDEPPPPDPNAPQVTQCPAPTFRTQLLTSIAGTVPRDAALVVGLFPGGADRDLPTVQLTRGRRTVALIREPLAPGLYRLRPDTQRLYGRYDVAGVQGSPNLTFARGNLPGPPVRPALSRIERYVAVSHGESRTELRVEFDYPIPEGVVAVVAYFGDDDQPDLFAQAIPTRPSVVLWSAGGRCVPLPEGATEPPSSGSLRVAFVDQFGRMSSPSEPRALR